MSMMMPWQKQSLLVQLYMKNKNLTERHCGNLADKKARTTTAPYEAM